jgi:hypothetical protein
VIKVYFTTLPGSNARKLINTELEGIGKDNSRDSSVGIAAGYGLQDEGGRSYSPGRVKFFSSPHHRDRPWGHLDFYPVGTGDSFLGIKVAGA